MGYTHYFGKNAYTPEPTPEQWQSIVDAFRRLYHERDQRGLPHIQYETNENIPPCMTDEVIRFNGPGNQGHETMLLFSSHQSRNLFNFCKTARKTYDVWVTALLTIAHHIAPNCWVIRSDGSSEDWEHGVTLARSLFPDAECPIA